MLTSPSLVGNIVERRPDSSSLKPVAGAKGGFPVVEHRSKSAFARARMSSEQEKARVKSVPVVVSSGGSSATSPPRQPPDQEDWREQTSAENVRNVEKMTKEEREKEKEEIIERFGSDIGDILKRARENREQKQTGEIEVVKVEEEAPTPHRLELPGGPSPKLLADKLRLNIGCGRSDLTKPASPEAALRLAQTRPPSRSGRKIRFAEVTPKDVHVYESAPPSPRKKALALPSPSDFPDTGDAPVSLGQWKGRMLGDPPLDVDVSNNAPDKSPNREEGTPGDIRRRFFPNAPTNDPSIAWMEVDTPKTTTSDSSLRFDLNGNPISDELSASLPTHLGLHHHAEGSHAGYTLEDIFLLSRSTVPAQRASMLSILAKIATNLSELKNDSGGAEGMKALKGREAELRKRILAAGVEAVGERGSLGARAIEAIWECLVGWDDELNELEGVELQVSGNADDPIVSLPLDHFLPQITSLIAHSDLSAESKTRILAIIDRLARHNNEIASRIVKTPKLIATLVQTFLLTPIPSTESSPLPDPTALHTLITLALSSREVAKELVEFADALLRFVALLPPASPFPPGLATTLLTSTLYLYTTLASYGLYAGISTTASAPLNALANYVLSDTGERSPKLRVAWAGLVGAWTVCATDPHRTTPEHDILWSQVVGWSWSDDLLALRKSLGSGERDREVWRAVWGALAAWLEGVRVNGVKGGERERTDFIVAVAPGFESGIEREVVGKAVDEIGLFLNSGSSTRLQECASHADVLAAVIYFWLACSPDVKDGPLETPPFSLPFSQISQLCATLVSHDLWALPPILHARVAFRSLTSLLSAYLRLSRRLPNASQELWMAQAFTILSRLVPGDEEFGIETVSSLVGMITPEFANTCGWPVPPNIWERGGLVVILPFLVHEIRGREYVRIGPLHMTPESISLTRTQRLPSVAGPGVASRKEGLPLFNDWPFSPLNHLLRSGTSEVFKSLPPSWDASEIDVTRCTLLFAKIACEILERFGLRSFALSREEAVFGCMKVFMLEHEQEHDTVNGGEIFRDGIVGGLMSDLLSPFTTGSGANSGIISFTDLEKVAARFLGPSTPFYQYYTDFVALYDAISFSHPLFASLLIPPLSMRYAVDYRRLFWNDYAHSHRTIRIPFEKVISGDVREFLWPVESDSQVISSQVRALSKGSLSEFLRFLALHHVACNIWPDLGGSTSQNAEGAGKLLKAVLHQAPMDVVRDVALYFQDQTGPFKSDSGLLNTRSRELRLDFVRGLGDDRSTEIVAKFLQA